MKVEKRKQVSESETRIFFGPCDEYFFHSLFDCAIEYLPVKDQYRALLPRIFNELGVKRMRAKWSGKERCFICPNQGYDVFVRFHSEK